MRAVYATVFALTLTILSCHQPWASRSIPMVRGVRRRRSRWRRHELLLRHAGAVPRRDIGKRRLLPAERLLRWAARDRREVAGVCAEPRVATDYWVRSGRATA